MKRPSAKIDSPRGVVHLVWHPAHNE